MSPRFIKSVPTISWMERHSGIVNRRFVQPLIIFIQLIPSKIDSDAEVLWIRKISSKLFIFFQCVKQQLVAKHHILDIAIGAGLALLTPADVSITLKRLYHGLKNSQNSLQMVKNLPVFVR